MPRRSYAIGFLASVAGLLLALNGEGLLSIPVASAATTATATDPVSSMLGQMSVFAGFAISSLNFLAWFLFYVLDIIMDPQWIFDLKTSGADGNLMGMLREIWQLCRDLVNMAMAILLIYEAIVMIVKADGTKVKELLPKFVLALVAVNFSWFIPRAIFDASQILTYTVYQIPNMIGMDGCTMPVSASDPTTRRPCEIASKFAFFSDTDQMVLVGSGFYRNDAEGGSTGWRCPLEKVLCVQMREYTPEANLSARSKVLNGLIINYARLRNLIYITDVRPPTGGPIGATGGEVFARSAGYLIKLFIAVIIHIALVFPLLAMVAGFAIRIPILWVTIALMPLVAIGFVMGDKLGEFNPMKVIWEQFLSAVFLPVKVALPFVIGFVLLNAGSTAAPPSGDAFAGLSRPIAIFSEIRDFWQMLWMVIALGIIWKYSFEILKKDPLMGHFAQGIQDMGKNLGSLAAKIPMSAPVIPWGADRTSLTRIMRAGNLREINTRLDTQSITEALAEQSRFLRNNPAGGAGGVRQETINNTINLNTNLNRSNAATVTLLNNAATGGLSEEETRKRLTAALARARSEGGAPLTGATNNQVLEALLREHAQTNGGSINTVDAERLRKILRESALGSSTVATPAP